MQATLTTEGDVITFKCGDFKIDAKFDGLERKSIPETVQKLLYFLAPVQVAAERQSND